MEHEQGQEPDDRAVVAGDQLDRSRIRKHLSELGGAGRRSPRRQLRHEPRERLDELVARLGHALDDHRSRRDSRRSLSTRPPVWHSEQ